MRGFTLIEIMVSVAIFAIVMTVALGALLAMSESDRRAEALKTITNNLDFALDSMTRTIRTGYYYHCGSSGDLTTPAPADCSGPGAAQPYIALKTADGKIAAYCLDSGAIKRELLLTGPVDGVCSASAFLPLTSSAITVNSLQFIVTGAAESPSTLQPKVTILMSGSFKVTANGPPTQFNLQTSVTQRIYDQ